MGSELLGIDIGSTNVKVCHLSDGRERAHGILAHEGDVPGTLRAVLGRIGIAGSDRGDVSAVVTGTSGRHRIALPEVIGPVAVEAGLEHLGLLPRAVVSMGGEDLVVYGLDGDGHVTSTYSGNKCASGTGEFFRQQLGRMDLELDDLEEVARDAKVHRISARCSVFMKSDCTHRLNKGESTVGDIALSLSKIMADKVSEFLIKARVESGRVALLGGVTRNRFMLGFLEEDWPSLELVVPEQAPYFEAFGAALLAGRSGAPLPSFDDLFRGSDRISFGSFPPLGDAGDKVRYVPSVRGRYDPEAEYVLGVDGGSTTTKVALVDTRTHEIAAQHYGRTHGDPVGALKECIREIRKGFGGTEPRISLVSTTGSSRELLGVFLETPAVYNEIISHAVGTTYFEPEADTIFEIGGQDAKYVYLNNSVPIDYAMNEACSAGTGSFLEESARGDLNIDDAADIGPIAMEAEGPLKFGEHCSAFINSDIRKAIQEGASQRDIVAGLVHSIVLNYLNRVVGNRYVGDRVMLQGGVAKNPAVPLAFATLTGKKITVPPDPELMGAFGVALLAERKARDGLVEKGSFELGEILEKEMVSRGTFVCKACENLCEIRRLEVAGRRYPFGGRCSKYTNARKKKRIDERRTVDYTEIRSRMLFEEFAPDPSTFVRATDRVVGVPMAFSVHSLWPLYSWFFHTLGVEIVTSKKLSPKGIAKLESSYCFPAEIAHGAIQDVVDEGVDYLFLPHFKDMPSMEEAPVHATLCPLMQGLPFFARQAFELDDAEILRPLVSFKHGWESCRSSFEDVADRLGLDRRAGADAFDRGLAEYRRFLDAYRELGEEVIERIENDPETVYVGLLGRPYNAFTRDANMQIPRKFTSRGVTVVPFDMLFRPEDQIFPNMYWYYGQQNMKAVRRIQEIPNLYAAWISNFSCAPDSFMLHYLRWMLGQKPYLVLEIDSHSADAGLDTRIEAFLDIVESYRSSSDTGERPSSRSRYEIALKKEFLDVVDRRTGERIDIRDPRVTLGFPSMGDLSTEIAAAAARRVGIDSFHLPVPDVRTTQLARNVASGKECIPALLVLGQILQFMSEHPPNRPDEIFLFFVPTTLGPCRTGQYHVFYERLFEELGWQNVLILVADSANSYREMGPTFNRDMWWALVLGDYFTDVRTGLRLMAEDPERAAEVFERCWRRVVSTFESGDKRDVERALALAGRELSAVPRRRSIEEIPRVIIVGEIYVRRDTFSVREICDFLVSKGIFPKVTGVTEWVHYTDHARKFTADGEMRRLGPWRSLRSGLARDKAWYHVERFYVEMVEHKVARHLIPTGLVPPVPHDMDAIIENADRLFIDQHLESEATVSSGVAATAMEDGYSGVAIISPFACLPGRLIEGVYSPWARRRGYPVIALENDGQPYPPNVVARMEIFAHNVARYGNGGALRKKAVSTA